MAKNDHSKEFEDILNSACEFLLGAEEDIDNMTLEQVESNLKDDGIDGDALVARIQNRVAEVFAEQRTAEAEAKHKKFSNLLGQIRQCLSGEASPSKEQILNLLRSLAQENPQFAVQFRKFEDISDADSDSLYEALKLLEKMAENHDNNTESE